MATMFEFRTQDCLNFNKGSEKIKWEFKIFLEAKCLNIND